MTPISSLTKKNPILTTIITIVVVLVIVFYVGKAKGASGRPRDIRPDQLPNSGSGIPQGWTPSDLANRLYDNFTGGLFGFRFGVVYNDKLYKEVYELPTNDMLAAVYWDFTNRYGNKDKDLPNLRAWIESEGYINGFSTAGTNYKELLLSRLQGLSL